jgi:transcription antitermination factor NusG
MICRTLAIALLSTAVGMLAGCEKSILPHKLVVTGNEHSVSLYPDEHTYLEVSHQRQQGGLEGIAGDVRSKFSTRQIDDQTPVKVVSTDDNGTVVEIVEGPMKGQTGFVAKQNLD